MPDIIDVEQGSAEWFAARCGLPTASKFATIMAKGRGGGESKTRQKYLYELAGEIITGQPTEGFSNAHTERGHEMEPDARTLYEFTADVEVHQVGMVTNGLAGASPDGLIASDGGLEIKSKLPSLMVEAILRDGLPPEHRAQVQGSLWVTERDWWDFAAYWPGFPLFLVRVHRDEEYIAQIAEGVAQFRDELDAVVAKVRSYGEAA